MNNHNDTANQKAAVILAELTERSYHLVKDFLLSMGDSADAVIEEVRRQKATPPLLALVDSPAMSPHDMSCVLASMTVMLSDDIAAPYDASSYATALVRGVGMSEDDAEAIAEKIVTPDAARANAAFRVLEALPDLPEIQDESAKRVIAGMATESVGFISRWFSTQTHWKDTVFEWLKLGQELFDYRKKLALMGVGYGVQYAAGGIEKGDPMDETGDGYADAGLDVGSAINALVGWNAYPESGDPLTVLDQDQARQILKTYSSLVQQAITTPYHDFANKAPEQGGLFSGLGKLVKGAFKAVKNVGRTLLRPAATLAGTVIGGPLGGVLGDSVGRALSGGGNARHAAMPSTHAPTPMLSAVINDHREPNGMPRRLNRPVAAGASGLIADVVHFLQSRGYR